MRQAVGWTVLRDAADGRPPHIWAPGLPDINHAKAFAASLMTFGCIANMDVDARCLLGNAAPLPGKTPVEGLEAVYEVHNDNGDHVFTALGPQRRRARVEGRSLGAGQTRQPAD